MHSTRFPFGHVVLSFVFSQPFGNILSLVPLAESVVKLTAVCMQCYKEAAYTKRLGAEQEVGAHNNLNWLCHVTVSALDWGSGCAYRSF